MMVSENVRMGLNAVRKSRFRSVFTMLGVIIGVVSVVTVVSLGEGVKRQVASQVSELGDRLITVRPGKLVNRDNSGEITSINLFGAGGGMLTPKDLETIKAQDGVESAVSFGSMSGVPKNGDKGMQNASIIATQPELINVIDHPVEFGTFFKSDESTKRVAVIGAGVAEELYGEAVPIGKSIIIREQQFVVQGIFEPFRSGPINAEIDYNNAVFIPNAVANALTGNQVTLYEIMVKFSEQTSDEKLAAAITSGLLQNHAGTEDFTVLKEGEAAFATGNVLQLLTNMIVGMAAITLVVGGVGIMNVMLASVSERTREIGIRKAIGATNHQIRQQFMVEATVLSIWGVIIGVVICVLFNFILRIVTDLEPILTWQPIAGAAIASLTIGIVSGVIPAVKAARKDPIDALRPN